MYCNEPGQFCPHLHSTGVGPSQPTDIVVELSKNKP